MYNMIFVLFTGIDHHHICVTFGAGLLFDETIDSYKWLLQTFLDVHGTQPALILTDQDPTMKQAIAIVFNQSVHRLCMWHIMNKLPVSYFYFLFFSYQLLFYICVIIVY
jgi:zinc finger SWIM domain-containing protein 3